MKDHITLRDILVVFFKYKTIILTTFLITILTVIAGTILVPKTYEAHSILLLKYGREYAYQPEIGNAKVPSNYFTPSGIINVEIRILTSQDLLATVINHIGVEELYPHMVEDPPENMTLLDAAVLKFKEDLTVQGIAESNMLSISFQHTSPPITDKVVNLLVELYKEKHLETFNNPTASTFLKDKVISYQESLRKSEEALLNFKQQHQTFSFKEQQTLYLKQRSDLDSNLKDANKQIAELEQQHATLSSQFQATPENTTLYSDTGQNSFIDRAKEQLLQLQLKEQELLSKYPKTSSLVTNAQKEIQVIKNFINEQEVESARVRIGRSETYKSIERDLVRIKTDLASQQARRVVLKQQLEQVDDALNTLALREKDMRNLQRELATNERSYHTYVNKFEETRISDEMDRQKMTNIRVIQMATTPIKPIKPRENLNYIVGLMMGVFFGVGLAFLMDYSDQSFSTPDSTERHLKLPVLATVPLKSTR